MAVIKTCLPNIVIPLSNKFLDELFAYYFVITLLKIFFNYG